MSMIEPEMEEKISQTNFKKYISARKFKKKMISIGVTVLLLLISVCCAWLYGRNQVKQATAAKIAEYENLIRELKENPIVVNPVAPEIELSIIEKQINDISELATVEYMFTDAARFTDSKQWGDWNIPFTEKSFLLKWDGVIKAGIDVSKITIKVNQDEGSIIVTIPEAEIFSYDIDESSVEVLDEKDNIFNSIKVEDKIKFDESTEAEMKNRAIENGLLEQAQENAERIISEVLYSIPEIKQYYEIQFEMIEE